MDISAAGWIVTTSSWRSGWTDGGEPGARKSRKEELSAPLSDARSAIEEGFLQQEAV